MDNQRLINAIAAKLRYFITDHTGVFPPRGVAEVWIAALELVVKEIRSHQEDKFDRDDSDIY